MKMLRFTFHRKVEQKATLEIVLSEEEYEKKLIRDRNWQKDYRQKIKNIK